jgi:hypothetical protein
VQRFATGRESPVRVRARACASVCVCGVVFMLNVSMYDCVCVVFMLNVFMCNCVHAHATVHT